MQTGAPLNLDSRMHGTFGLVLFAQGCAWRSRGLFTCSYKGQREGIEPNLEELSQIHTLILQFLASPLRANALHMRYYRSAYM